MNILVTGAAGYIGSILTPMLLKSGHKVTALDNFMYNQCSLLDCCLDDNLTVVRGDVRNASLMEKLIKNSDAIFPLACLTGAPLCAQDPVGAQTILYDAIEHMLKLTSKNQMIVFPTTNSGYGIGEKGKHCDEKTPLRPISLYGKLKVRAEEAILASGHGVTLRLATAFGVAPRMRLDLLVNDFVYRAYHDRFVVLFEAHFKRNYIHVRDIARAFIHAVNHFDTMKNQPYNVGLNDANLSKLELCQEIKKQIPEFYFVESTIGEDPDKRDYIVSNDKITRAGFLPEVSLSQGITELIKAYKIIKRNQYANI